MSFTPLSDKYRYDDKILRDDFPKFIIDPLRMWVGLVLNRVEITKDGEIRIGFINELRVMMREEVPYRYVSFFDFIFEDRDRILLILQYCLDAYANEPESNKLNDILIKSGLCWCVAGKGDIYGGGYELHHRVSPEKKELAGKIISIDEKFSEVWRCCYGINPDYNKAVQGCQNILEGYLQKHYFPNDKRPNLSKYINDVKANLKARTDGKFASFVKPESLFEMLSGIHKFRGIHTNGQGEDCDKRNAEAIVLTTMYFIELHSQ